MNEESSRSGQLSNSWCEGAEAAAPASAPPNEEQPSLLSSPSSSSSHSDFEIFDEDEVMAVTADPSTTLPPSSPPPLPSPPPHPAIIQQLEAPLIPALEEAPRSLPPTERKAQERRLLLALHSLRGDGAAAAGCATPSPMEAPSSPAEAHVSVQQEPPRVQIIQHSAEEESLPESDIQLEDSAQHMAGAPEAIEELMDGDRVRRYQHSPNAHLNARLNGLVMCAVLFVLGLAVGHFLGSTHERFSNHFERADRNDRIKSIQTELLQCARKYDELELQLNEVKATLVQKEYVDKWESLYQEGEEEKAALTATMNLYKSRYNTQKQLLTQCELRFGELEEKVAKDKLRNLRCQPCPKVDLSCPRELAAVKASLRALLQLTGAPGPHASGLPCNLSGLLPSWPALRAFLSNRLHNATALLMEALPADWTRLHDHLLRSPTGLWSKLTGGTRRAFKRAASSDAPRRKATVEKAESSAQLNATGSIHAPEVEEKEESDRVNWFLLRRSSQAEESGKKDGSWFWRGKGREKEPGVGNEVPTTNGFWYWRRGGKKLPPLASESVRPPAKKVRNGEKLPMTRVPPAMTRDEIPKTSSMKAEQPPATTRDEIPKASRMKMGQPPATTRDEKCKTSSRKAEQPPATTRDEKCKTSSMKAEQPPATTHDEKWKASSMKAEQPPATTHDEKWKASSGLKFDSMTNEREPSLMTEDSFQPPSASNADDWRSPGDIDDESEPSDWLEAFMQLREQMLRAQQRIWRSLKLMASRRTGPREQKAKRRRKRKKKSQKKRQWSWESEGE